MTRMQPLDSFNLDDDGTVDDEVESLLAERSAAMEHDDLELSIEPEALDF